jgi:hypothetical protein
MSKLIQKKIDCEIKVDVRLYMQHILVPTVRAGVRTVEVTKV